MHKTKPMSLEALILKLRIQEDNQMAEKKRANGKGEAKANIVDHGRSSSSRSKSYKKKEESKGSKWGPKKTIVKRTSKEKFLGKCFNCSKEGHRQSECRRPKKKAEINMMEELTNDVSDLNLCAVVTEVNLVGSNTKEWWVDTGATRHVCANKKMFTTFTPATEGDKVFMGNSTTSTIEGEGKIVLKMTSEKELTLNNVMYVPEIRKNLISGSLLSKHGFRLVFEADKVVLSKNGMYIGRGYMSDDMFKLNVLTVVPKKEMNNKTASASTYMLESSNVWHGRLEHVNYGSMRRLANMNHIPNFSLDNQRKCEICVEAKLTRTSFQAVERSTKPLDLIHSDACDLKFVQTRGGSKYFITFVDDCTRYCYVYLLKSKDEAIDKFILYKNKVENQLSAKIKVLRSDRGGEYESPFSAFCAEYGIIHQTITPYSPQQNGVAERKNRTLKEMMNAMLISSG
ncbi:hypothetical protein Dimus_037973 [Dionaea muscipula]